MVVFDQNNKNGYISGVESDYRNNETETVAKNIISLTDGDKLDFVCDYYSYDGEYLDSYYLGEQMTYNGDIELSNVNVGDGDVRIMYCFTDIYNQEYWTEAIMK